MPEPHRFWFSVSGCGLSVMKIFLNDSYLQPELSTFEPVPGILWLQALFELSCYLQEALNECKRKFMRCSSCHLAEDVSPKGRTTDRSSLIMTGGRDVLKQGGIRWSEALGGFEDFQWKPELPAAKYKCLISLNSQFAHLAELLGDVASARLNPGAHRWILSPALRPSSPSGGPSSQVQFQVSVYLIFFPPPHRKAPESQMAHTDLPGDELSLGRISHRKVPSVFPPPWNPAYVKLFQGVPKLVLINAGNQALTLGSWQLGFPLKVSKTSKEFQIKKGSGYGASEAPWFPWNSYRDGSHVCPDINAVATHGAFWAAMRAGPGSHFLVAASG